VMRTNFWTSGLTRNCKFTSLGTDAVRVRAQDADSAKKSLYAAYMQLAPAENSAHGNSRKLSLGLL
jgi:hypothetical protein